MTRKPPKDVSLCDSCFCMTKTIDGFCGKCGTRKIDSIKISVVKQRGKSK